MKALTLILISFFAFSSAQASQISCADQIKFQVSDWLEEGKKVVSVQKDLEMTGHTLYEVQVGLDLDGNMIGIPYRAVYKVLTENGPQGTCALIDSKLVSEVQ